MQLSKLKRDVLKQRKFQQLLITLIVFSLLLGLLVVFVEKNIGNITTIEEGIWWAITTVTAVGFGDFVPVTTLGRMIGITLEVLGVVMFGLLIAIISTSMNRSQEEFYWKRIFERMNVLESQLSDISKQLGFMVKHNDDNYSDETQPKQPLVK